MSKLARKFLLGLSSILIVVILFSVYLNSNFIERYFLYEEKRDLSRICDELAAAEDLADTITRLEKENDVVIAWMENSQDNDLLNERLRDAYLQKGLGMGEYGNFWLWDQDRQEAVEQGRKLRIYHREKLHYSLMVQYVSLDESFLAVAKIIPAMAQTIDLINLVTACVFSGAAVVMILLISFLVKKITLPLGRISQTARAIARLDFQTVEVKTGDELELLAEDINDMSGRLKAAHQELGAKNRQMEALLANVSHDLKTPVSLVKAYANGIRDGMDDDTFLDTILLQNEKMEQMIERLLELAKARQQETAAEAVDVTALLNAAAAQYQLQAAQRGLSLLRQTQPGLTLNAHRADVQTIVENLVSNAVKYACEGDIVLTLQKREDGLLFETQNRVDAGESLDLNRLWEPFYVAEESRNKDISGTGLGLSIVRAAAQKHGYSCSCTLADGLIRFTVIFR